MGNRHSRFQQATNHEGKQLIKSFSSLVTSLKSRPFQTTSDEIAQYICQLPITKTSQLQHHNESLIPQLKEAQSLEEIFDLIEPFIKFNRYELLKFLVDKFGEEEAKRELQEYTSSVEKFNQETTVGQLVELLEGQQELWTSNASTHLQKADAEGATIKMILDSSYSENTLDQLYSDVSSLFECEEYVLALADASFGSINLLWYTSTAVISYLSDKAKCNIDKTREMKVNGLKVGHEVIIGDFSLDSSYPISTSSLHPPSLSSHRLSPPPLPSSHRLSPSPQPSSHQPSPSPQPSSHQPSPSPQPSSRPLSPSPNSLFTEIVAAIKNNDSREVTRFLGELSENDLISVLQMVDETNNSSLLHIAVEIQSLDIVKSLLLAISRSRELNLRWLTNTFNETPLQLAFRIPHEDLSMIKTLLKYPSFTIIPAPNHSNLLALAAEDPVYSLAKLKLILEHSCGNPLTLYPDFTNYFPAVKLPKIKLETTVPVIVVGDKDVGKSTLIKSLQIQGVKSQIYYAFVNVSDVSRHKAGIIPTPFESTWYGNVIFYDLSSHRHFVHEAIQQCGHLADAVFIIVVNLHERTDNISRQLVYWFEFIDYHHKKATIDEGRSHLPNVAIVGSHLNKLRVGEILANRERFIHRAYPQALRHFDESQFNIITREMMDCRKSSIPNTSLRLSLSQEFRILRANRPGVPCKSYILYEMIKDLSLKKNVPCITINDVLTLLDMTDVCIIESKVNKIIQLCQPLCELNLILLLQNKEELDQSWIIVNARSLLCIVEEAIFNEDGLEHDNGVLSHDQLCTIFRPYSVDPEMMIKLMIHYCYCSVSNAGSSSLTANNKYFFPHILPELPTEGLQSRELMFAWSISPRSPFRHFMPHVIHQFLLQLSEETEISGGRYERACHTLITSFSSIGLLLVIHVHSSQNIIISMATEDNSDNEKIQCLVKRNDLIAKVCQILQDAMQLQDVGDANSWIDLDPVEVFISGRDQNYPVHYPVLEPPKIRKYFGLGSSINHLYSVTDVKNAVKGRLKHVQNVNSSSPLSSVEDLLNFEPYYYMNDELRTILCSPDNANECISGMFFEELARALYVDQVMDRFYMLLTAIGLASIEIDHIKQLGEFIDKVSQAYGLIEGRGLSYGELKKVLDSLSFFKLDDIM